MLQKQIRMKQKYQKKDIISKEIIINLLDNTPDQLSKFRTKNWIEINDQSREVYHTNSDIRFKTTMLVDAYILVKGRIGTTGAGDDAAARRDDERNKKVIFKKCASLINCTSEINDTEISNAKDIDVVMPIYILIEYSYNYPKPTGSLWQYYKDERNNNLADSELFKSEGKITRSTPNNDN